MVISCPRCNRKYQIDTTRIPAAGTSFTCWSCRETVPIEPPAAVRAAMDAAEPPLPAAPPEEAAAESGSAVPPAAMRFFESLAAEAATRRASAPLPQPPPAPESSRTQPVTLDLLAGDNVLDLPPVHLSEAPPAGEVIDVGLAGAPAAPEPEPERGPTLTLASPPPFSAPTLVEEAPPALTAPEPVVEPPRLLHVVPPPPPEPVVEATPPPITFPRPAAETPAEAAQRAWVAPAVEEQPEKRQSSWIPAVAAVAIIGLAIGAAVYWLSTKPLDTAPRAAGQASVESARSEGTPPATSEAGTVPPAADAPEPAPQSPPAAPTAPPAAESADVRFTIQLRSSPQEADSRSFADTLRAAGFDAYVARADLGARGTWYRVRVGRYGSRAEAQQAVAKLRASGSGRDAIVVAYEAP
jgi:cell division septation protein DedD